MSEPRHLSALQIVAMLIFALLAISGWGAFIFFPRQSPNAPEIPEFPASATTQGGAVLTTNPNCDDLGWYCLPHGTYEYRWYNASEIFIKEAIVMGVESQNGTAEISFKNGSVALPASKLNYTQVHIGSLVRLYQLHETASKQIWTVMPFIKQSLSFTGVCTYDTPLGDATRGDGKCASYYDGGQYFATVRSLTVYVTIDVVVVKP